MTAAAVPLLDVRDLTVEFSTRRGLVRAVQHVDISVAKGETLGIVGESGSGKSVTSYAVMRILDRAGRIAEGSVSFTGVDLRDASEDKMRDLRGREISMIFQNPRAALNPIRKVGHQIEDVLRQHAQAGSDDVTEKAVGILEQVRIARPKERYHAYPFELSGGMCQRVVIALALACRPQLLIADEPTTGLDVTTQKTVMDLVVELDARARHVDHPHHPRSGARGGLLRPRGGDGEGQRGGDRHVQDHLHRALPRLHQEADARHAAARRDACATCCRRMLRLPRRKPPSRRKPTVRRSPTPATASRCWWSTSSSRNTRARTWPEPLPSSSSATARRHRPRRAYSARSTASASPCIGARAWASSAESGCGKSTTSTMVMRLIDASDGAHHIRRPGHRRHPRQALRHAAHAQAHPDGVPGPHRQPQSALHGRAGDRRPDPAARQRQGPQGGAGALRGAGAAGGAADRAARPLSRISCPAARRRASASPGRSRSSPSWSSWTSRRRRSTSRCRRWCSICCRSSRRRWA